MHQSTSAYSRPPNCRPLRSIKAILKSLDNRKDVHQLIKTVGFTNQEAIVNITARKHAGGLRWL